MKKQKEKKAGGKKKEPKVDVDAEASVVAEKAEDVQHAGAVVNAEEKEKDPDKTATTLGEQTEEKRMPESNEKKEKPSTKPTHDRQPSISLQSKMRSSSFRRTSEGQRPLSPTTNLLKSPTLPPLSPDGDTIPDIYRKQANRLEELEKENKRLDKEAKDAEARWRKTEEELEEAREANSQVVELRAKLDKAEDMEAELARLVGLTCNLSPPFIASRADCQARRMKSHH